MMTSTPRWSNFGIAALMVTLIACSPDQPPSVAVTLSPALQAILQEMGTLGAQHNREQTYTYMLADNCELHATKLLNGHPIKHMVFLLKDTRFGRYDYAPGLGYAVRSFNPDGVIDNVLFESPALESIDSMLRLIEKTKAVCVGASFSGDYEKVGILAVKNSVANAKPRTT